MNNLERPDLPERRAGRILFTELAWREHRLAHFRPVPATSPTADRSESGAVGKQYPDAAHDAFPHVVGQFDVIGEDDLARGLEQAHVSRRGDHVGALVVGDGIRQQHALALGDFHVARGDDHSKGFVIADLVGGQERRNPARDRLLGEA